jgi:hypothetical protein
LETHIKTLCFKQRFALCTLECIEIPDGHDSAFLGKALYRRQPYALRSSCDNNDFLFQHSHSNLQIF